MRLGSERALHAQQAMRLVIEQHKEIMLQLKPSLGFWILVRSLLGFLLDCTKDKKVTGLNFWGNILICFLIDSRLWRLIPHVCMVHMKLPPSVDWKQVETLNLALSKCD